jgi:hypothetical protein
MRSTVNISYSAAILILAAACTGRDADPVDAYTPYDNAMACNDIAYEMDDNNKELRLTVEELQGNKGQNVAVGVIGAVLFWPVLFALDLSDAEETEIKALERRNKNLVRLGVDLDCELPEQVNYEEALADYHKKYAEENKHEYD